MPPRPLAADVAPVTRAYYVSLCDLRFTRSGLFPVKRRIEAASEGAASAAPSGFCAALFPEKTRTQEPKLLPQVHYPARFLRPANYASAPRAAARQSR